ncbi:MAG: hypothetical protein PHF46_03145 [Candidatus Gracilibacteria bacterium]|nr:hypothetical protein [Candidatus Gracilibacteria bacterium]MDD4530410.1 hypothetical protein [Candidatus Gracilibacteria bacterium]
MKKNLLIILLSSILLAPNCSQEVKNIEDSGRNEKEIVIENSGNDIQEGISDYLSQNTNQNQSYSKIDLGYSNNGTSKIEQTFDKPTKKIKVLYSYNIQANKTNLITKFQPGNIS